VVRPLPVRLRIVTLLSSVLSDCKGACSACRSGACTSSTSA
jgi:hypothetical protein